MLIALLLAACSQSGDSAGDSDVQGPVDLNPVGEYEAIMSDGLVIEQSIRADGSYQNASNGEILESGTWQIKNGELCFDPEGVEVESCFAGGNPEADQRFMVRDDTGEITMSVRKVEQEAVSPETVDDNASDEPADDTAPEADPAASEQ